MSIFKRFTRDEGGNVAIIFALALIPLFGAAGAVVDYARASDVKSRLANALDAGVLAVGSQPPMSDKAAYDTVKNWLDTHMKPGDSGYWSLQSVTQHKDGRITAVATGSVDTTITNILGVSEIPIGATAEAIRSIGKVEVVLVLDNTGSMASKNKIGKLRDAADALVDTLAAATKDPTDLRIGLVPFSQTVNVGSEYATADWLDKDGKSDSAKSLFLGQEVNRLDLFKAMGTEWGGCVENRSPAYEATETVPVKGSPNTLHVPYFAPDEPGNSGKTPYNNSYLKDSNLNTIKNSLKALGLDEMTSLPDFRLLQGDILKYGGKPKPYEGTTGTFGYSYGPNSGCEIAPLQRLTSNAATVKAAIQKMIANGNTDIPIGATWGWNVLSDKGPFGDGVPYGTDEWTKVMVLMTDGLNENHVGNEENKSYYSGIGYVWQERQGVAATNQSKSQRTTARDKRLVEICDAMKAKGIVIYSVRVEVGGTVGANNPMLKCATTPDDFYNVENVADLTKTFENIGGSIQKLRLAK